MRLRTVAFFAPQVCDCPYFFFEKVVLLSSAFFFYYYFRLKGCGMGPPVVLVSPCFRENVVVTWSHAKLGLFTYFRYFTSEKTSLFSFLEIKFQNGAHLKKRATFGLLFIFLVTSKNTYFAHPIDFFDLPIVKKMRIYQVWFLFGVIPGVDSYSRQFGTINKYKMVSKT